MSAYVVFCVTKIDDADELAAYRRLALPQMEATPGLSFFAGPEPLALEGPPPEAVVVVAFPDREAATAWYHSDEYQAIAQRRLSATEGIAFIVDSWPATADIH